MQQQEHSVARSVAPAATRVNRDHVIVDSVGPKMDLRESFHRQVGGGRKPRFAAGASATPSFGWRQIILTG